MSCRLAASSADVADGATRRDEVAVIVARDRRGHIPPLTGAGPTVSPVSGKRDAEDRRALAIRLGLQCDPRGIDAFEALPTKFLPARERHVTSETIHGRISGFDVQLVDIAGAERRDTSARLVGASHGATVFHLTVAAVTFPRLVRNVRLIPRQWDGPDVACRFPQQTGQPWLDATFACDAPGADPAAATADPAFAYQVSLLPPGTGVELAEHELVATHGRLSLEEQETFVRAVVALAAAVPPTLYRSET